ncbi:MAG TPA: HAD family hydrolase [Trueperaceae bacterium]
MLLAFDLDNTLITHDHVLPAGIQQALAKARQLGHCVTVLTGRTRASTLPILEQLGLKGPYSVNHGALVVSEDGEILHQAVIPATQAQVILERYGTAAWLEPSCVVGETLFVRDPLDERWNWAHTLDQRVMPLERYAGEDADKIVFSCSAHAQRTYREITAEFPELVLYLWANLFLEMTGAGGHKGAALQRIAAVLGIAREDTVAFGDGVNDVSMLEWAGRAVAVGPHAYPEVLAVADEHIAAPEEDGVARWLEENVLAVRG